MRSLSLGNGVMNVNYDEHGQIVDLYFPNVGLENQSSGNPQRVGFLVDGAFRWMSSTPTIVDFEDNCMAAAVTSNMGSLKVKFTDFLDRSDPVLTRIICFENSGHKEAEIRVYLHHDFYIYDNPDGDTALFDPSTGCMLHYKGRRYIAVTLRDHTGRIFDQYAVGKKFRNEAGITVNGTYQDAEDGVLSSNPIQQGAVDSVISIAVNVAPLSQVKMYSWIVCGRSYNEIRKHVAGLKPAKAEHEFGMSLAYWSKWLDSRRRVQIPPNLEKLYQRSLLLIKSQADKNGALVASTDFSIQKGSHDSYNYVWPRDAAYAANAMDIAGYPSVSLKLFEFLSRVVEKNGYLMQKYNPNGTLASSWHPWVYDYPRYLPIQEDETALTVWAVAEHYRLYRDVDKIAPFYRSIVVPASKFILNYMNKGLPSPTYDLWEERFGVHIHTCSTVYLALKGASLMAAELGDPEFSELCSSSAESLRQKVLTEMTVEGRFVRSLKVSRTEPEFSADLTVDSTILYPMLAGMVEPDSILAEKSALEVERTLTTPVGGIARYAGDAYMLRNSGSFPNPWIVTTLWLSQYKLIRGRSEDRLRALDLMEWVAKQALPSGVLAEQYDSETGKPTSVSPLTWSHAEFIRTLFLLR
ncbi:MAG: glycoside hydrolase family 15 protein [Thermoprotei archaeon]